MSIEPHAAKTRSYGLHLMLDGYGANSAKLADIGLLYNVLNNLPGMIGMHKVGFPHIIQFTEGDIAGISGFIFIVESHISVHTYSRKKFLSMDAYSCKEFDYKKVVEHITAAYEIEDAEKFVVTRGTRFPQKAVVP